MTQQILDRLHDGEQFYWLHDCPGLLPPRDPRWSRCHFVSRHTANARGYTASWRIDGGRLLLAGFGGSVPPRGAPAGLPRYRDGDVVQVGMVDVHEVGEPLVATWISGDLTCATVRHDEPIGRGDRLRLLRVEQGDIVADVTLAGGTDVGLDCPRTFGDERAAALLDADQAERGRPARPPAAAVPGLAHALGSGTDPAARRRIASLLWQANGADLAILTAALDATEDPDLRRWIAYALGRIGPAAAQAAPALAAALGTTADGDLLQALVYALDGLGAPAWAFPGVVRALDALDRRPDSRQLHDYVDRMVASSDSPLDELVEALLAARRTTTRYVVANAMGRLGQTAVPPLLAALHAARDETALGTVALALGRIGSGAAPAADALVAALGTVRADETRRLVADALRQIGLCKAETLPMLGRVFRSSRSEGGKEALARLMGSLGSTAVGALVAEFEATEDDVVRRLLAEALGTIGPGAKAAIGCLWQATRTSGEERLLLAVAEALPKIGASGKIVLAAQIAALRAGRGRCRSETLLASMSPDAIPPDFALDDLASALLDQRDELTGRRIAGLRGGLGRDAVAPLRRALRAARTDAARVLAIQALGRLGALAAPAMDAIAAALAAAASERARLQIIDEMKRIGPPSPACLAPLLDVLGRPSTLPVQWRAGLLLAEIGAPAVEGIAALLSSARDDGLRRAAANALGLIGRPAELAVPSLQAALGATHDARTRDLVTAALRQAGAAVSAHRG